MGCKATVLIPTFDHGPTLISAVDSALSQTVQDIEIFIVGDGIPDSAREAVAKCTTNPKVRFFDFPKGADRGELHRHTALQQATGEIVCYLSDDDLWFPGHIEYMQSLLTHADFAVSSSIACYPTGKADCRIWLRDIEDFAAWNRMLCFRDGPPLSTGAHTLSAYNRLPVGWSKTAEGVASDLTFWNKFIASHDFTIKNGERPTVLKFCSMSRKGWTSEERARELSEWRENIRNPRFVDELISEVSARGLKESISAKIEAEMQAQHLRELLADWQARTAKAERSLEVHMEDCAKAKSEANAEFDAAVYELRARAARLEADLAAMRSSRTWRAAQKLARTPGLNIIRSLVRS